MSKDLNNIIVEAMEDLKAQDIVSIDVTEQSDVTDRLVIASGTSNRHVKSVANNVVEEAKSQGFQPLGVEGMDAGEWVLVDFGDTVVHVMQAATRSFYELEKLWSIPPANRSK